MGEVHLIVAGIRSRIRPHGRQRTRRRRTNSSETVFLKIQIYSGVEAPLSPDPVAGGSAPPRSLILLTRSRQASQLCACWPRE